MKLHTCQMSKWRKAKALNIPFYDITVKSGDKLFAPSWKLLTDYKNGGCSEEEYTKRFLVEMRGSFHTNKQHWLNFINTDEVVIACYCKAEGFCHRYLFVDILEKLCNSQDIEFEYKGELK